MRNPETGLPYPKIGVYVAAEVPYLLAQASERAGFRHSTLWLRDRIARALAAELDVDYDQLMVEMPPSWETSPGAVHLSGASKAGA